MGAFLIMMVTFLWLLLPMMILVALLTLIPRLRRSPAITYGIVALLVILATVVTMDEYVLPRSLGGGIALSLLALDYRRTVRKAANAD